MVEQIFFIAGVHGTGKTTLCSSVKKHLKIPHYSCSTIIREQSEKKSNLSKIARDVEANQPSLTSFIQNGIHEPAIVFEGHFSLFTASHTPHPIAYDIFDTMNIKSVLLLTCEPDVIVDRIFKRDLKHHPVDKIADLQNLERKQAETYCKLRKIEIIEVETTYGYDIEHALRHIDRFLPENKITS